MTLLFIFKSIFVIVIITMTRKRHRYVQLTCIHMKINMFHEWLSNGLWCIYWTRFKYHELLSQFYPTWSFIIKSISTISIDRIDPWTYLSTWNFHSTVDDKFLKSSQIIKCSWNLKLFYHRQVKVVTYEKYTSARS